MAGRPVQNLIPGFLNRLSKRCDEKPDEIFALFFSLLAEEEKPFVRFLKWEEGKLFVKVTSHTLYSHLVRYRKEAILAKLCQICSFAEIKEIIFR
ncbi:MAG: hypothetical protein A3F09_02510 [Chlamydiae bacterium RIFCSPHIGHO2_12_FULL_49_11]|nr:MAG: hypothetical protein A3F09_02510 [Chlamydiae bacterium RIFCSPHIGHO2_12_FULL_49_11]